jgi:hypothetical protein
MWRTVNSDGIEFLQSFEAIMSGAQGIHFVRINGKILGPFAIDQLRSLRDRGRLHAEHEISADRRQWRPAGQLAELFEQPKAASEGSGVFIDDSESAADATKWFYSQNGQQAGPVSFQRLKSLAEAGTIHRNDLIWHEGLTDWILAEDQPGIFSNPHRSKSKARISSPGTGSRPSIQAQTVVWDILLETLRDTTSDKILSDIYRIAVQISSLTLTAASILLATFVLILGVKHDSLEACLWGLIGFAVISTSKFIGVHLSIAADELIQSTPNRLSSKRFTSTVAARYLLAAFSFSAIGFFYALKFSDGFFHWKSIDERWFVIAFAIQIPFSALYAALAALHTGYMNITIDDGINAAHEGIAIRSFGLKLAIRFAAIWFATGSLLGFLSLLWANILILKGEDLPGEASGCAAFAVVTLIFSSTLPFLSYWRFTYASINLAVKQSILLIAENQKPSAPTNDLP